MASLVVTDPQSQASADRAVWRALTATDTDSPVNGTSASTFAGIFELLSGS